jgi:hypothetical protein
MKIQIDLSKCKLNNITPDQYVLLYLIYHKDYNLIEQLLTRQGAINLKNELVETKYILSKKDVTFKQTLLSNSHICKLLDIREDKIKFVDFYIEYPIRVGSRVLRAANVDTVLGAKHQKKYLSKVTTKEQHDAAIAAICAFVNKQRVSRKLEYLPNMETVLNNAMWEQWSIFVSASGEESANWNNDSI